MLGTRLCRLSVAAAATTLSAAKVYHDSTRELLTVSNESSAVNVDKKSNIAGIALGSALWNRFPQRVCLSSQTLCESSEKNDDRDSADIPLTRHSFSKAAEKALPFVVNISCHGKDQIYGPFRIVSPNSTGSGIIIESNEKESIVLTNAHVVGFEELNNTLHVTLHDGRLMTGSVIALDSISDICIVKVKHPPNTGQLPIAVLGVSSNLRYGEWIVAVGSPLSLQNSVAVGVVSNVKRAAKDLGIGTPVGHVGMSYIQTDCPINVGNSGGPLVNLDGEVVAISTLKADGVGISFGIPIDFAKTIVHQLKQYGSVRRPFLGVQLRALTPELVDYIAHTPEVKKFVASTITKGILLVNTMRGGPADRAGLHSLDVIVQVNGVDVDSTDGFMEELYKYFETGATLTVVRGPHGKRREVFVEIEDLEQPL